MGRNGPFYVSVFTLLALTAVVGLVVEISRLPEGWQSSMCRNDGCTVQQWVSATSGWAGFVAAMIGAYFVFHQLAEQRKQTSFALGDGEPTFEILRRGRSERSAIFRITNWNRRTVVLRAASFRSQHSSPKPKRLVRFPTKKPRVIDGDIYQISENGNLSKMGKVPGWLDRQAGPISAEFWFSFVEQGKDTAMHIETDVEVEVIIDYFFTGDDPTSRSFKVRMRLSELVPSELFG
ncbi:hypothetical protein [Rhizobium laguerreae]|uniref:Uncharacterized protein n=1 Tax=Rhizobium laguerreae TaxID=1076926 RepID=A0A6N9ZFZ8_9HYPH|nr:hypothetical protein [Rhizobium laguerreae]NEH91758.1 hypothetical protein [Rhizobium laguerreae]